MQVMMGLRCDPPTDSTDREDSRTDGEVGVQTVTTAGSTIFALRAPDVVCRNDKLRKRVRVVCISDTHGKHHEMRHTIPDGDILVHCGDFSTRLTKRDFESVTADFNSFLGSLGHKHKLVIAGNHEIAFNSYTREQIQRRLSNATYLEDSAAVVENINFYGSPWTNSCHMGFSRRGTKLKDMWAKIPVGVDILLTHMPPYKMRDLAFDPDRPIEAGPCRECGAVHRSYAHWGSYSLLDRVAEVVPKVHVFGHVHNSHGIAKSGGTVFINAAQEMHSQPIFFDIWP
ncbi:unnamed protein product [Choristocarpus tenellus]